MYFLISVSARIHNIISYHHNFLLAHFANLESQLVNLIVSERSTWKCSRPMHRAVENNTSIALREQRTVLEDNHRNVTRTTSSSHFSARRGAATFFRGRRASRCTHKLDIRL